MIVKVVKILKSLTDGAGKAIDCPMPDDSLMLESSCEPYS
jgi:hypothetical protein